ncbi:hypothetical protein GYMLUDRAFT_1025293 [Collybiopsis luxurians FD-317 M1]|uniref:Nephrocystin 3-like N-terminal domain-containing protein n=1 Tax=Collybiopsis luxurians FD-317 M1 TaxID=944289 RepID=A0A0D0BFY2_9AGAR|nr:hypothetical protein GYMLUDRAFT_1025293 [Collybiopsis luxurians FD-317 M1]
MAKHNKSQGQGNSKPKRKRDRFLDLFKFNRQGSRSPTLSSASSAGVGTNVEGMTQADISGLARGQGDISSPASDSEVQFNIPTTETVINTARENMHALNEPMASANQMLESPGSVTIADLNDESKMSSVHKAALVTWKTLHKLSEVIEPWLDGTPFKIPLSIFNMISTAAEATLDNKENVKELFHSITEHLTIVEDALLQRIADDQCISFAKFLIQQAVILDQIRGQKTWLQVLQSADISSQVQRIVDGINTRSQRMHTALLLLLRRDLNQINMSIMFQSWPISHNAVHNANTGMTTKRESCTPGTRIDIITQIETWVSNMDDSCPPIFWISGMAGTGKSTIAKTICEEYNGKDGNYQLGASFFCSRQLPELRAQKNVIPTVVYQLANRCEAFQHALKAVDKETVNTTMTHALKLLLEPWKQNVHNNVSQTWLVVIDALDELEGLGGSNILKDLLNNIAGIHGLKVLVTSRPDHYIVEICKEQLSSKTVCHLEDVEKNVALQDISKYIYTKLAHLTPSCNKDLDELATQCDGLFIYAATAIRYISENPGSTIHMSVKKQSRQLKNILKIKAIPEPYGLTALYNRILDDVLGNEKSLQYMDVQIIISTIVCAKEPLTVSMLAQLIARHSEESDEEWVGEVINGLHAVVYIRNDRIYIYHKSFLNFFPKDWICNQNIALAKSCMDIMLQGLHFNMCNLASSYVLDSEVLSLGGQVEFKLGNELGYAVQYWIAHLIGQQANDPSFYLLAELMEEKVLFWVECMNLMQKKEDCYRNILNLQIWLTKNKAPLALMEVAATVDRLVKSFTQTTASLSTPHLYLSSLATEFATTPSATKWKSNFRNVPQVLCTDALTGEQLLQIKGHTGWVLSAAFSSDGTKVISGSHDATVRLWNALTGEQEMIMNGHTDYIYSVAFSPDDRKVVSGSKDKTVRMWDAVTGNTLMEMVGHTDEVYSVAFSPDGVKIVSGSADKTICIWDAGTGEKLKLINGHSGTVWSVVFSLDGARLVSGSADDTVCIWDAATGDNLLKMDGHINEVNSVAFSSDGTLVVSGSDDRTVRIWDTASGRQLKQMDGHSQRVWSADFSPDGSKIMSGSVDQTIRIWDAIIGDQPKSVDGHTDTVRSVAFSSDGSKIVSGSKDKTICTWDGLTGDKLKQMDGHTGVVNSVAFSYDGSRVVSGSNDSTVCIWDTATGGQLKQMCGHSRRVWSVAFSLNGSKIVSGSADQSIRIWDAVTGVELMQLNGHTGAVKSVAFSSDRLKIVSGSEDKTVCIWDGISGDQLKQMDGHTNYVLSVNFSFDGARVVSGSADHIVCVWDVATGEQLQQIKGHAHWVQAVAFSSDGSKIVSGSDNKTVRIWDAATGEQLKVMDGHTDGIYSVAFSPDGSKVVSGSRDQSIRIWDAATGQQHKGETGHIDCALSAAPSSVHATNILSETQNESGDGGHAQPDFGLPLISPSSPINSSYACWNADNQGWIKPYHSSEQRLMWLPPSLSYNVVTPNCLCIISRRGHTSVQFNWDCIGNNWAKCYTPTTASSD